MTETQLTIFIWADATFGPASDASIAARALEEMAELVTACVNGEPAERIGEEIADVVIVLARLGRSLGVDVIDAVHSADPDPDCCQSPAVHSAPAADCITSALVACEIGHRGWAASSVGGCMAHLMDTAARVEVDLPSAIDRKMAVNRARRWVVDERGHGRHVKEVPSESVAVGRCTRCRGWIWFTRDVGSDKDVAWSADSRAGGDTAATETHPRGSSIGLGCPQSHLDLRDRTCEEGPR